MRDQDLVQRAERAATALEQAWMTWCGQHGLEVDRLPPVSSYVGYSVEEPWGQPRVVLGICADGAEQMAAILNGHECVGPVHAGIIARPERRQQSALTMPSASAPSVAEAADQTPDPAAEQPLASVLDHDTPAPAAQRPAAGLPGLVALRPRAVLPSGADEQASVPVQAGPAETGMEQAEPGSEQPAAAAV
jgi:hypothetical protein